MQINQASVKHLTQVQTSQVHLNQAVAVNRPTVSPPIKEANPKQEVNALASSASIQRTQSAAANVNQIENDLSQSERERAVVDSGVFQSEPSQSITVKQQSKVEYDAGSESSRGAISAYMMTMHAAKRDEIQQMVGIDLYA
ncbi:hypothetical protein [Shewanella aestuarii]|uniref:Uncharacterized protein n=1 Tax=Shewanella aestuarii TaxID=1028752 RepID=A0A6G9QIJ1_9GAMM|nr:hypothetical protein [Shewanella aestuarii]QIR14374.1 hypothetical protein HBH39_07665 [Shewanella aestuarii]